MQDLRVTTVQTSLFWQDIEKNLVQFSELLSTLDSSTDLIVLPEMFSTGFTMQPEKWAQTESESAVSWMQAEAQKHQAVITGSLVIEENGQYFNRLFWVQPNGEYSTYNKRHLFSLAKEQDHYTQGKERLIVTLKGWRICPLICFDLRFPVWSRNNHAYDALIYVANWPHRRSFAWKQLLIARAIENQSFVIGVNRVGSDGNQVEHSGDSVVLNPLGEAISSTKPNEVRVETNLLKAEELKAVREKFQFLNDQDGFTVEV